ncbi:hypothetical protein KAI58_02615 [Candidatus Gracilibacteria bacterium]|nr:hypothetical protein [Candidatus Gracilibacteria bacterium]
MKKTILVAFLFVVVPLAQAQVMDSVFLDSIESRIFRNESFSIQDTSRLLELSSEGSKKQRLEEKKEEVVVGVEVVVSDLSSEDPMVQSISTPTYSRARRSFAHVSAPKKIQAEEYFELSNRNFDTSLNFIRERQKRAIQKALRYRTLFQ